jgi:alpha-glucosidase
VIDPSSAAPESALAPEAPRWWQRGIVYQIYPRSFQDSNGDGVGDIPGIVRRLDHLHWLGVDALWISPFYPSPMADFGYDVTDHCAVHPMFGTMDDVDRLVREAHARDMRVIVDFVPNHVALDHPWFVESRSSRGSAKRDWFVWRDGKGPGEPPNNWRAVFGGSAWTWDDATRQWWYHAFLPEQPDLDCRNPAVRAAMLDVLRFWLARGVDGFRVDAIHHLIEDDQLRDEPANPAWHPEMGPYKALRHVHTVDHPEVHGAIAEMRALLDEHGDTVMVTEAYLPMERVVMYYGEGGRGAQLPFNFQLITLPWDARIIARAIDAYEAALPPGAWPNWVLSNHDRSRIASRVGDEQARVAAMLLLTLRGTPTVYQGDEIGLRDVPIPPEMVQDPWERNMPGLGYGRDPERTPMQWDASPNAGFTTGAPWLPLADDWRTCNVEAQRADPRSMLTLHRRLVELRRAEPALAVGSYRGLACEGSLLAYVREHAGRRLLVALMLEDEPGELDLATFGEGTVLLSTHLDREGERVRERLVLRPDEGVVVALG